MFTALTNIVGCAVATTDIFGEELNLKVQVSLSCMLAMEQHTYTQGAL